LKLETREQKQKNRDWKDAGILLKAFAKNLKLVLLKILSSGYRLQKK
jgi:hypothetical protein